VHAVGDGFDVDAGKHLARSDAVLLGDAVDVHGQVEGQMGHIQHGAGFGRGRQIDKGFRNLQDALHERRGDRVRKVQKVRLVRKHSGEELHGKTVVASRYGRMRGENAHAADFFDVFTADAFAASRAGLFGKQLRGEQGGVAFVHVEAVQLVVSQRAQNANAADAEQNFLAQAVVGITTVQAAGERAVYVGIAGQIGVNEIDGNVETANAFGFVAPTAEFDLAAFDG
jgi:hypothetical protein